MKKFIFAVLVLMVMLMLFGPVSKAEDISSLVVLSVSTPTPTTTDFTASKFWVTNPLVISTAVPTGKIRKITIMNSDPSVYQDVKFYEWGGVKTSSESVRLIWMDSVGGIPAYSVSTTSTTITAYSDGPTFEDFGDRWWLVFKKGLIITKSSTASTVAVSIQTDAR